MMNTEMKAVILAAGKGTRMRELTSDCPKPMLQVGGKPVLELILASLRSAGVQRMCIITGYRAETIRDYFGNGSMWGVEISYVTQVVQDGTGKAPELAKEFVGDSPFFLVYGDILTEPSNYLSMAEVFGKGDCDGIVTVKKGEDVSKGAAVVFDDSFCLVDLIEKPPVGSVQSPWYNAGVYLFTPELFKYTANLKKSPRNEYELPDALRAMAKARVKIRGVELRGYWMDVRDPEVLAEAQKLLG